jgi:hypothetical protein
MAWCRSVFLSDQELSGHSKVGNQSVVAIEFKPQEFSAAINVGDASANN